MFWVRGHCTTAPGVNIHRIDIQLMKASKTSMHVLSSTSPSSGSCQRHVEATMIILQSFLLFMSMSNNKSMSSVRRWISRMHHVLFPQRRSGEQCDNYMELFEVMTSWRKLASVNKVLNGQPINLAFVESLSECGNLNASHRTWPLL